MSQQALKDTLSQLGQNVALDTRWDVEGDDLGISILGMLLFGYGLAQGRMVYGLELEQINQAVVESLTQSVETASTWTSGLIAAANAALIDPAQHQVHQQLIQVGQSYITSDDQNECVENIYLNIASVRQGMENASR